MATPEPDFIYRYTPAPGRGPACTLLLLHGTGGDEGSLLPLGPTLDPSAALLSPRGKVLENGMPRFFRRFAEGVFDLEDLRVRTAELAAFVEAATARHGLAADRILAVGYSNGANIAASLLLLRPGLLAGALLLRPMVPLVPEAPPDLRGVPVFIAAGRADAMVPPGESERLAALLGGYSAEVTLRWHDGGHGLAREEIAAAAVWLRGLDPGR